MTKEQLESEAYKFRQAIEKARAAGSFRPKEYRPERMNNFPHDCCDDIKRQEELQRQIDEYEIIIAKEMWLKHSRRHEIQSSAELIDELQKKKRIQEEKVKQAKMELLDRQRDYPEYELYTKVTEEHKKKLLEYHDICEEIAKIKTAITEIDKQYHL